MSTAASGLLALVLGVALAPGVLWILRRRKILDIPNERSSHQVATPRGGGIASAVAATVAVALSSQLVGAARMIVLVTALGMGLIGLADDLRGIKPLPRLLAQLGVALAGLAWVMTSTVGSTAGRVVLCLCAAGWVVSFVNAFNFMDGINGISVAQVVVAGGAWWAIGHSQHVGSLATGGLVVAGAGLAFAPFNVPRPAMFLGDVGSYFLGGWLAATAIVGLRMGIAPEAVLAPLAIYAADTLTTLIRRVLRRESWYLPHREHVYQRMLDRGWSHSRTSLVVGAFITVCSALGALSLGDGDIGRRMIGDIAIVTVVLAYLAMPVLIDRRNAEERRLRLGLPSWETATATSERNAVTGTNRR